MLPKVIKSISKVILRSYLKYKMVQSFIIGYNKVKNIYFELLTVYFVNRIVYLTYLLYFSFISELNINCFYNVYDYLNNEYLE